MLLGFILSLSLLSLSGQDTLASKIMFKVYHRPKLKDMHALITMILVDNEGRKSIREIETWSKTDPKTDETKMLMKFIEPSRIKGTAFLIYQHKDRDDDIWLYLLILRKIRRVVAAGKAGSFMGSDFSHYDIGGGEYEDWNYKLLREDTLKGQKVWVIEALPKHNRVIDKSGYSKEIKWVSQKNFIVLKTQHFDKTGELFKETVVDTVIKLDGVWFEKTIEAINLDSGHRTIFNFHHLKVNQGLKDSFFTLKNLGR